MGKREYPQGIQKLQGEVKVNGVPAEIGTLVNIGDVVTTGTGSLAIFVVGRDVYLLRDNTELHLDSDASKKYKEKFI